MYELKYLMINVIEEKEYKINIESRIRSLETSLETKEKVKVTGYVFIANLCDIVEIFNEIGNEIFEYNVRLGINDKLDVAKEITKTIKEEPNEFWFLNNGITILINDNDFRVKKSNSVTLKYSQDKLISIINGAQTITTAAEVFYDKENKIDKKETSKVMLRIINIKDKNAESDKEFKELANKISISLNRQKPIAPEDLAFTTEFISNVNNLYNKNRGDKFTFQLVKRSKMNTATGIKIDEFVRSIKAYLEQNPGQARSQGRTTLIKIENNDSNQYSFKDNIFKKDFYDIRTSTKDNLYKYYKPVNLAIYISNYYQTNAEKIKDKIEDEEIRTVINYGKWFFVAYVIFILNFENNNEFSNFDFDYPQDKNLDDCIMKFSQIYKESIKENTGGFDSNNFKNSNQYNEFKNNGIEDKKKLEMFKILIFRTLKNDRVEKFTEYISKGEVAVTKEN
jgi:hypothetical protein